jgi:peptide chain release factor subunit 3
VSRATRVLTLRSPARSSRRADESCFVHTVVANQNYVPHMIGGAAQADIGILVISARKGEFETGFERGGQTREHAMLAKTSGVRQLVVVINKLDDPSVLMPDRTWSERRFNECRAGLEPYLKQVGWNIKEISWIPVSGLGGDNLKDKLSEKTCPWYRGDALLDHLEKLELPERSRSGSVKMPISERHKEMGTMVKGKLESGVIRLNDKLVMMPNKVEVVVDAVELEGSTAAVAEPGDNVRLRLKGIDEEDIRCGFVLCSPNDLVSYTNTFDVRLMILEHKSIICAGYSAVMHIHQVEVECTIEKLLGEIDKKTGKISKKNPKFVKPGMKCFARIQTAQPICIEPFAVFPQLGRFMMRDEGKTIAVGTVMKVKELQQQAPEPSAA